jgi:hypothetical protein
MDLSLLRLLLFVLIRGFAHGLRNEMSKLLALNKLLRLDLFFVILKLYLRDLPFQARLLLAKRIVNVGLYLETYDF